MELISDKWVKAKKLHTCSCCGEEIKKGDRYHKEFIKDGSYVYTWKGCERCDLIIAKLWNWIDPEDGITSDEFYYACHDFASDFLCNSCNEFDGEDCTRCDYVCLDKIYEVLKTHDLVYNNKERRWELKKINSSYENCSIC